MISMASIWVFFLLSNKSGWWTWWVPVRVRRWPQDGTRRLKAFFLCHNEYNHDFHHHQHYLNHHHHHHQPSHYHLDNIMTTWNNMILTTLWQPGTIWSWQHYDNLEQQHGDNIMTTWNNIAPLSFFSMSARAELSPAGRSYNIKTERRLSCICLNDPFLVNRLHGDSEDSIHFSICEI